MQRIVLPPNNSILPSGDVIINNNTSRRDIAGQKIGK